MLQDVPNTGYNRHFKYLKDLTFNLPKFNEQVEIANILSSTDREISTMKEKHSNVLLQKKYLVNNLVTGEIRTPEDLRIPKKEVAHA